MPSLQLRHSRTCQLGKTWTGMGDNRVPKPEGCTCQPSYTIVASAREAGGRRSVGQNFKVALKELDKANTEKAAGNLTIAPDKKFSKYADEWLAALELEATTIHSYRATIAYAKKAFGSKKLRAIGVKEIREFLDAMPKGVGPSTKAKHLRVLSGVFNDAVGEGLVGSNPVRRLPDSHRPKGSKQEAAYFENAELLRLLASLEGNDKHLVRLAVMTGMRAGELIALQWDSVDLQAKEIHVHRAYKDGFGVGVPKSETSRRKVLLTDSAVDVLGDVLREAEGEVPADDALVFPSNINPDGYRRGWEMTKRLLHPAMKRAGLPNGRTFHSLRHTYARLAFENGASVGWVSRQLGHSNTSVTEKVYEHWSHEARKREAAKLEGAWQF